MFIDKTASHNSNQIGAEIYSLIKELFPICRSITGDGVRKTLRRLQQLIPIELHEVPSGTQVFDWTVPKEWNIRDAWVKDRNGERVIDFKKSNLHVLNYSMPFKGRMSLAELKPQLFTLPDRPGWVPYRTSYYKEAWGFCLSHNQVLSLPDDLYDVCVDSTLADGHLTYGECFIPGQSEEEILISTHVCHPSLANDNLSGVCTAAYLARHLCDQTSRYSYRFLFIPGTIGAITWLCLNQSSLSRIRHGLVLTGLGDSGGITYKKSRRGDAEIDRSAEIVLRHACETFAVENFSPYGYDERQFCSPGFNLPIGRFSRTPYGKYPEYHTSADNLDFIRPDALAESYSVLADILKALEGNAVYSNLAPHCEPQLGKRGLYDQIGPNQIAMLWVLNYSDGGHSLLDISEKSGIRFQSIRAAADVLAKSKLIEQQDTSLVPSEE